MIVLHVAQIAKKPMGVKSHPVATRLPIFLERLRSGGPWVLTAIDPTAGKIEALTAHNASEVLDFVCAHDGKRNIYFSLNPTRTATTRKAAKTDIVAIEYLLADLDPRDDESPEDAKAFPCDCK